MFGAGTSISVLSGDREERGGEDNGSQMGERRNRGGGGR